jgi:hypothetical protein
MYTKMLFALLLSLLLLPATFAQNNWSQFRGAGSTGVVADDANLPETWSRTENVAWAAEIPGVGWSSPVGSISAAKDRLPKTNIAGWSTRWISRPAKFSGSAKS